MQNAGHGERKSSLPSHLRWRGRVWVLHFFILTCNYVWTGIMNQLYLPPGDITEAPGCIGSLALVYLFSCNYAASPVFIVWKDGVQRFTFVANSIKYAIMVDALVLSVCSIYLITGVGEEIVLFLCIAIQAFFCGDFLMVYLMNRVDKRAVEMFFSVVLAVERRATHAGKKLTMIADLLTIIGMCAFSCLLYFTIANSPVSSGVLSMAAQMFYFVWFYYVCINFITAAVAAKTLLVLTSSSNDARLRNLFLALKLSGTLLGEHIYLGLVSVLLILVTPASYALGFGRWNRFFRMPVETFLSTHLRSFYFYRKFTITTTIIAMTLFGLSPAKTVDKLLEMCRDDPSSTIESFRYASSKKTTWLYSFLSSLFVLGPASALMLLSPKFLHGIFFRLFAILLWAGYEVPTLAYLATETIHRSILLLDRGGMTMNDEWVQQYLQTVQI